VLLGSLGRLPVGMLADRFGGRLVFSLLMLLVAVPAWLVPNAVSFRGLLTVASWTAQDQIRCLPMSCSHSLPDDSYDARRRHVLGGFLQGNQL